jgi:hypothetical protein
MLCRLIARPVLNAKEPLIQRPGLPGLWGIPMKEDDNSTKFNAKQMQAEAERMIADGTMPPPEEFFAAIERIRKECAEKIVKARERDQREESER